VSGKENLFLSLGLDGRLVGEFHLILCSSTHDQKCNSRESNAHNTSHIPVNQSNKSPVSENIKTNQLVVST